MFRRVLTFAIGVCLGGAAQAVPVLPVSYDSINGWASTFSYWDETYSGGGCKTCNGAPLTGGLGDLTDGIVATANWNSTPLPYVGWLDVDPTITFHFGGAVTVNSVTIHVDDSKFGGVAPPASVTINGSTFSVIDPPANTLPFSFTVSGLSLTGPTVQVTINRGGRFTMASEISFDGVPAVPELAPWQSTIAGLALIGWVARRRSSRTQP